MSEVCKECGHVLAEDLTPGQIGQYLKAHQSLYYWEDQYVGHTEVVPGLGEVEVVHNSYLSLEDDGAIKLVFGTQHGYVGIEGYFSSYSGSRWNDNWAVAEKKTMEVVYFD
jgi:hypothetical protein